MPDDLSPVLALPLLMPSQAQKHVTHNEALCQLEVLVQAAVLSRGLSAPPSDPPEGGRWLVAGSGAGDWADHGGQIAYFAQGGWGFLAPHPGWQVWVADEGLRLEHNGSTWGAPAAQFEQMGLGTGADANNRLAVSGPASLFTHSGTGGHQIKLNKASSADTASVLWQTNWSGRAEFGLTGSDDFALRVSPNGSSWTSALTIAASGGEVRAHGALRLAAGSASAPGLRLHDSPNTGLYRAGSDQLGFAVAGVARAQLSATGLALNVPLTGTSVTQSATDSTAGRLQRVGDYGWPSALALTTSDDLDSLAGAGLWSCADAALATVGRHYPEAATGTVLQMSRSGGGASQLWITAGTGVIWSRVKSVAGVWMAWTRQTPERGTSATGSWVRFADGTQICQHSLSGSASAAVSWSYPQAFAAAPVLSGVAVASVISALCLDAAPGVSSASFSLRGADNARRADTVYLTATGRWY